MVFHEHGLDRLRQVLHQLLDDSGHLRLERDLFELRMERLLHLLVVHFHALCLCLLLIDLHLTVLVMDLDVLGNGELAEVGEHSLAICGQLELEIGLELGQIDVVAVRLFVRLLELKLDL